MAIEIIDSRYGEVTKSLHDLIIIVLAKEYPLKMGEISKRLKKVFNVKLSFQAIRKSLNIMAERKILVIKDKAFSINKNYVLESKRLSDQLLKNYFGGEKEEKSLPTKKEESHSTYAFENIAKADQFWNEVVYEWVYNLKQDDEHAYYFHGPHLWYMFGHLDMENNFLSELRSHDVKIYNLIDGDTVLDRWARRFYEGNGSLYKVNSAGEITRTAIGVFGDYILQYDYPEEMFRQMEDFYKKSKDFNSTDLVNIAKLLKMKANVNLIVLKNKAIAAKIREDIRGKFTKK